MVLMGGTIAMIATVAGGLVKEPNRQMRPRRQEKSCRLFFRLLDESSRLMFNELNWTEHVELLNLEL
jgi:hypothetical protein